MVSDNQVRGLRELMAKDNTIVVNAAKAGMDAKTARKYLRENGLPSELVTTHTWRTREDPFEEVWPEVHPFLELNPGLEAKTLFEYLQRTRPGRFADGQLRSFQRGVRRWRALEGPPKEVFFEQEHQPGYLCQSDFTYMHELGVTVGGEVFDHLLYHFVLLQLREADSTEVQAEEPAEPQELVRIPEPPAGSPNGSRFPRLFPVKRSSSTFPKSRSTVSVAPSWCTSERKQARSWM